MDKQQIVETVSKKIRLVRHEKGFTQEQMAEVLGLSKKTLVQIEKERSLATWTCIVAVCALFRESEILQNVLGDDPLEVIELLALDTIEMPKEKTMGGKVWWKLLEENDRFKLQQNMVSQHYRIIDQDHYRWFSSFDQEEACAYFKKLSE
ncbi:helix-turn-helix domain-containing protein [Priestia koreensis]|uniref:helix-turn-helix domain-containing protein n=1 Tax=Priestia koreensis TaxID=284581 RepID=UPI001F57BB9F|nr:helix-turn-helix domain-containing protein [Priestia koreensis]UNL83196.1 helix-turn-helix domain-containing protein [Priestia koreensis]